MRKKKTKKNCMLFLTTLFVNFILRKNEREKERERKSERKKEREQTKKRTRKEKMSIGEQKKRKIICSKRICLPALCSI